MMLQYFWSNQKARRLANLPKGGEAYVNFWNIHSDFRSNDLRHRAYHTNDLHNWHISEKEI